MMEIKVIIEKVTLIVMTIVLISILTFCARAKTSNVVNRKINVSLFSDSILCQMNYLEFDSAFGSYVDSGDVLLNDSVSLYEYQSTLYNYLKREKVIEVLWKKKDTTIVGWFDMTMPLERPMEVFYWYGDVEY